MSARRLIVLLVLPALALAGGAIAAGGGQSDLAEARQATAAFHDLDAAAAVGYSVTVADAAGLTCIAQPGEGAMGVHMLDPTLLDGSVDAAAPEALVYEQRNDGTLPLVALEYLVFVDAWTGSEPPALFGRSFDLVSSPNRYGLPSFYALHAWVWKPNPSGMLYAWNPRVDCG
jgi:hypothetical protein